MNCTECKKPIILVPSAAERAKRSGGVAADYTALFTTHPVCALNKRSADTAQLMKRIREQAEQSTVYLSRGGNDATR